MNNRYVIILAAGQGSRMKSKTYKVLHKIAGKAMVEHVLDQVEQISPTMIVTIVGHGAEQVRETVGERSAFAFQAEQLGTGHAVLTASDLLADKTGTTLVVCGDTPLITSETLQALFAEHEQSQAKATILTALAPDPTGYGRIIRDEQQQVAKIVEQKDANEEEQRVHEINTGTFCFDNQALFQALQQVGNQNAQQEYYLPDVIGILKAAGEVVSAYQMPHFSDSIGINDRVALSEATALMRARINQGHMANGVTLIDPATTYIDSEVKIGADTIIEGGVQIKGQTTIGESCLIGAHSEIIDSQIGSEVKITSSTLEQAVVHQQVDIGPYAHLRPKTTLHAGVHIGNYVELKNATVGEQTKVGHLTYVGDATLGKQINVGCGTIFVNYDGKDKFHTTVGDHVFIGCNANLVAPLSIGAGAFIAAGSTVTKDVPADALAIARVRQENKAEYAKKMPHS